MSKLNTLIKIAITGLSVARLTRAAEKAEMLNKRHVKINNLKLDRFNKGSGPGGKATIGDIVNNKIPKANEVNANRYSQASKFRRAILDKNIQRSSDNANRMWKNFYSKK